MAKKKFKNSGIRYKKLSGKSQISGQNCLDFSEKGISVYEERDIKDEPSYLYWKALLDFLSKSGKFAQSWHLYQGIKKDPDLDELVAKETRFKEDGIEPDEEFKALITGVRYRLHLMKEMHECDTLEKLFDKSSKEWDQYRASYEYFIWKARAAGVDPKISPNYRKTLMTSFVSEECDGPCRREFYREKYAKKHLNQIKANPGPVPVVNIREIEKAFEADEQFKRNFAKKREKAKERDRSKREERMNSPRWKTKDSQIT